jgi:glyoxylase-like metal-dependent hydrolase (beta-lactamase superfamily II)
MGLYFHQLKAGREFGAHDPSAQQMNNFIYLIGDTTTREAVVVDPAWDIPAILTRLQADDMKLTGALTTHYHPDHVGGHLFGHDISGLAELLSSRPVKVYANVNEVEGMQAVTGLSRSDFTAVTGGDTLQVGEVTIHFIHTPGHTPGSQCFLVNETGLVAGDTLFIGACGRVDLPGGDPKAMYESLTQKLARLPDEVTLYPGHDYGRTPTDTMGSQKHSNPYLRARNLHDWLRTRGV